MTTRTVASWIPTAFHEPLRGLLLQSLKLGPLPRHVAIIMDGNRRWTEKKGQKVTKGHIQGFEALKGLLGFFLQLEVPIITVYAFAVDNFKRSEEEVVCLMDLAKTRLKELSSHAGLLQQYGIRVFMIGRKDLLPPDVQLACSNIEQATAKNTRGTLNVCIAYSSQEEIASAIRSRAASQLEDSTKDEPIAALNKHLYTSRNPAWSDPDVLIRTSGVSRLSDFLLWQVCQNTAIYILPCYWPDIGVADVVPIILAWQVEQLIQLLFRIFAFVL